MLQFSLDYATFTHTSLLYQLTFISIVAKVCRANMRVLLITWDIVIKQACNCRRCPYFEKKCRFTQIRLPV